MGEDDYKPAERPAGETSDRIRFEREGNVEQGIFGGSALDIEKGIWANQELSELLIGRQIVMVGSERGSMGAGSLHEIKLGMSDGKTIIIRGVGMTVTEQ